MAEVWDRGWFGGAAGAWRAFAPAGGIPHRGQHGGWSPEEMLVPLIVLRR